MRTLVDANVFLYLMIMAGLVGVLAKVMSHMALKGLTRAAGNMGKSNHRLMKLIRAKYEHSCMAHDTVDNTHAFVDKYLYEYRFLGLKLHTWRQLEKEAVWAAAVLTLTAGVLEYHYHDVSETLFRYVMGGVAETVFLGALYQVTDEVYRLRMIRMYMIDYLENTLAHKYRRSRPGEREDLNIISTVAPSAGEGKREAPETEGQTQSSTAFLYEDPAMGQNVKPMSALQGGQADAPSRGITHQEEMAEQEPSLRAESIRHILEEFLA